MSVDPTTHEGTYYVGEPIRCPGRITGGRRCNRAHDTVGRGTVVRVRVTTEPVWGGLERKCRRCGNTLAVILETTNGRTP
jgi:hypothetical protein